MDPTVPRALRLDWFMYGPYALADHWTYKVSDRPFSAWPPKNPGGGEGGGGCRDMGSEQKVVVDACLGLVLDPPVAQSMGLEGTGRALQSHQ